MNVPGPVRWPLRNLLQVITMGAASSKIFFKRAQGAMPKTPSTSISEYLPLFDEGVFSLTRVTKWDIP